MQHNMTSQLNLNVIVEFLLLTGSADSDLKSEPGNNANDTAEKTSAYFKDKVCLCIM